MLRTVRWLVLLTEDFVSGLRRPDFAGVRKVEQRDAYAIRLTPAGEKPIVHDYDTRTFLLLWVDETLETPRAPKPAKPISRTTVW